MELGYTNAADDDDQDDGDNNNECLDLNEDETESSADENSKVGVTNTETS